jgi:tRNA G10  N-methylase Trm11
MKYLFILGRNVELSIAEIKSFFEKEKINCQIISNVRNGLLVEIQKDIPKGIIDKLGGTISIGEVLAEGSSEQISKELDKQNLYSGKSNKLNYIIYDFHGKDFDDIHFYLKHRFKSERLKATEKKLTGNIKLQSGEFVPNLSSNLIQEQFFVFENSFGRITEICDYEKIEKRDMGKPVRRESLSISPRLAKILINLSQVKTNETLLDPFCGIGTILQEALLQNINVMGLDKDKTATESAKLNLKWFNFSEKDYRIINDDSSKVKIQNVSAIATEPDLGELQKRIPNEEKAKQIISDFEKLMINVIKNLKKNIHGKIVFTSPLVKTRFKKISPDFKKISSQVKMKIAKGFPIEEFREDSIVGRSIIVLE